MEWLEVFGFCVLVLMGIYCIHVTYMLVFGKGIFRRLKEGD